MSQPDPVADSSNVIPPTPPGAVPPAPAAGKPRRRRWLRRVAVVVVLLVVGLALLVALAPTLVGTGPVKNAILAQVNKRLNGRITVDTLSVGWTSGVHLGGVKVFDVAERQIASLDKADVPLPLLSAVRGKYPLGEVVVDGLNFDAKQDAAGQWNFAGLVKAEAKPTPTAAPAETKSEPGKLPEVSGDIKITRCHGTVTRPGQPVVTLVNFDGTVKIPDINQPIADQIAADVKVGDGPAGHVAASGTIAAVKNNVVDADAADVHQTIDVTNLDATAANAFLSPTGGVSQLAGMFGMHLSADVTGGKTVAAVLTVDGKDVTAAGKGLNGDTFRTAALAVAANVHGQFPDGLGHYPTGHVTTGDGGTQPATVTFDQGSLSLLADVPVAAIFNVLANRAPGAAGKVQFVSTADLGKLAAALPHTVHVADGVTVASGSAKQTLTVTMDPIRTVVAGSTDVTNVAGTRAIAGGPAKPIKLSDVHLTFGATDLGGNGKVPNLRDLAAGLQSGFATGDFHGATLADLNGKLTADLSKLLDEVTQFDDLNGLKLAGTVVATVRNTGDLTGGARQAAVKADVALRGIVYQPKVGKRIDEKSADIAVSADLQGTEKNTVATATNVKVTVVAGDAAAPTVSVLAEVPRLDLTAETVAADFKATVKADVAKAQSEFAAVVAGQPGVVVTGGSVAVNAAGKYAGNHVELSALDVDGRHLTVARQLAAGQRVPALSDDSVAVHAVATLDRTDAGPQPKTTPQETTIKLSALTVSDTAKLINVSKSNAGDLSVTAKSGGGYAGGGQLTVAVDLAGVNHVRQVLGMTEVAVATPAGDLKSGHLAGTVTLAATADGAKLTVDADLNATDVVVATPTGTLPTQTIAIVAKATASAPAAGTTGAAFDGVAIETASVKAPFLSAVVTDGKLSLAQKQPLDKVLSARFQVDVPDVRTAMALAAAFQTPEPVKPAGDKTAELAAEPRVFDAGSLSVSGEVSHDGGATKVSAAVSGKQVTWHTGKVAYAAKPFNLNLAATADATGTGDSLVEQIKQVRVTALDGDLGVGTLKMTTPITVANLAAAPTANGAIEVAGNLADLAGLAAGWAGKPADAYPYRGNYKLDEAVASKAETLTLKGKLTVDNFQSMDGSTVAFAEKQLAVDNDLDLVTIGTGDAADKNVTIRSLAVAMAETKALNFTLANGTVEGLNTSRKMHLEPTVDIDWAKAWPAIQPLAGEKYKAAKMAGLWQRKITVDGTYPAGKAFAEAIKTLNVDGSVVVGLFDYSGLTIKDLDLPFTIRAGKLVTSKPSTASQATLNDGPFTPDALTVDLTQTPMRLSTPDNKVLLTHATVNPLFTGTFLQSIVNNPAFVGVNQATGLLDLSFVHCDRLPAGALATQNVQTNDGTATVKFSLTDLNIGSDGLTKVLQLLDKGKTGGFKADIKDATVTLAHGVADQNVTFQAGQYNIPFVGGVVLATKQFQGYTIGFPGAAVARQAKLDQRFANAFPPTVPVPVNGQLTSPQFDLGGAVALQMQQIQKDPSKLLGGLLGGDKGNAAGNGNGAQPPAKDPVQQGLDQLFGGKKKR